MDFQTSAHGHPRVFELAIGKNINANMQIRLTDPFSTPFWLPRTEVDPLPAFEPFEQPRTPQEALVLRARMLAILKAPRPKQEFSCEICGGKMLADLKPMCPICKSRNVREVSVRCYLD